MNLGEFKRQWAHLMGFSIPTLDQYLAALRQDGLIKATGRGQAASDMPFDDALNLAVALLAGRKASQGPELVRAIRSAPLSRGKTFIPLSSAETLRSLGAKDESFASVMHALAIKAPIGVQPRARQDGEYLVTHWRDDADLANNVSDLLNYYPLAIDFHIEHAIVEIRMRRNGKGLSAVNLPDDLYLDWYNDNEVKFERCRPVAGCDHIRRCDWWLPYILGLVIDWRADRGVRAS